jgi:PAS domain S-box-containing protein
MVLLPARYRIIFMDGFETLIAAVCAVLCLLTAIRCSRFGKGVWTLVAAFFVLTALADFHDFFVGVFQPGAAAFPPVLEFLGWCTYLPLTLLIFYPLDRKDESPWNWPAILDFLQVSLVVGTAYFRFIYVHHQMVHQGWAYGGRPETVRNLLLSTGLLMRASIDPSARARAFYRRVGGCFATVTLLLLVFGGNARSISDWGRPAALLALGIFAAAWKDLPGEQEQKHYTQWIFRVLPMLGPVLVLAIAQDIPAEYRIFLQMAIAASLGLFFVRIFLTEFYRQNTERLQQALYSISEQASLIEDPEKLYACMHRTIGELVYARNFYIALVDTARQCLTFPYFADERERPPASRPLGNGLAEFVLRTGQPLLASRAELAELEKSGQVASLDTPAVSWLGIPLVSHDCPIGIMVVQSYSEKYQYGSHEKEVLTFVAQHVGGVIELRRAQDAVRLSEGRLRALMQHAPDAIVVWDAEDNRLIEANESAAELFGCTKDELVRLGTQHFYTPLQPDCRPVSESFPENTERALAGGEALVERRIRTFHGEERLCELRLVRLPSTEHELVRASFIDITDRKRTVEALQESEQRFRALIEQAPVAIGIARNGVYLYTNPMYLRTFGYDSVDEVVNHLVIEHVAPQCRAEIREHIRQRDQGLIPIPDEYETIACRKDGTQFPVHVAVTPVQLADGPAVLGFQTDITERKQAEELLRESETRFRTLIEKAPIAIGIARDGVILYANQMMAVMFGYEASSELHGHAVMELAAPSYREAMIETTRRRLQGLPVPSEYEGLALRRNGTPFPVNVAVTQVQLLDGPATLGLVIDVSVRKQAEEAVRRSEAELRSFVEHSPYGIARVSFYRDRMLSANAALVKMLGYDTEAELLALTLSSEVYCESDARSNFLARVSQVERFSGIELQWMRKDGQRLSVRVSGRRVRSEFDGEEVLEEIVEDVTEFHALHRQFLQAQKMEAVGRLAGGIAHDFNNVLGIIMGYTELLNIQLGDGHPAQHNTEEILKASRRAASLTQQLLAFSRKQVMQRKSLDVNALIADTEKMLHTLAGEDVRLVVRLGAIAPIVADAGHLVQVLMNLAVNARDAMPDGGRLIVATGSVELNEEDCRSRPGLVPGAHVTIAVSDTGIGMTPEVQHRIFEPFFTTKDEGKGTGLGLATVYGIVQQSEGYIEVESKPGAGTTFRIYLPVSNASIALIPFGQAPDGKTKLDEGTILLVEDEPALRQLLAGALAKNGYTVLQAGSGAEAFAAVADGPQPDLLVTDFVLPDTKGPRLHEKLCTITGDLTVVYISGFAEAVTMETELMQPGSSFLQKPFDNQTLLHAVKAALQARRGEIEAGTAAS